MYDITQVYNSIDNINFEYIEVPQSQIYSYDGNNVINLKTGRVIKTGTNIILYIMGMGPCRGLIIYKTNNNVNTRH